MRVIGCLSECRWAGRMHVDVSCVVGRAPGASAVSGAAPAIQNELRQYHSGRPWEASLSSEDDEDGVARMGTNVTSANSAAQEGNTADYRRRQSVRRRPYAPGQRRHSMSG